MSTPLLDCNVELLALTRAKSSTLQLRVVIANCTNKLTVAFVFQKPIGQNWQLHVLKNPNEKKDVCITKTTELGPRPF